MMVVSAGMYDNFRSDGRRSIVVGRLRSKLTLLSRLTWLMMNSMMPLFSLDSSPSIITLSIIIL